MGKLIIISILFFFIKQLRERRAEKERERARRVAERDEQELGAAEALAREVLFYIYI